jgi:hypothetical protein
MNYPVYCPIGGSINSCASSVMGKPVDLEPLHYEKNRATDVSRRVL